ncbi:hypothetical protein H696_05109 [Fonticula alba]|uniref:Pre-rRNA-processing protein RIX1 N-terminal domain-containing protein n=1 Tax=Fonticula alba TaxID=691883 RepID=A0A058Z1P0_FONAL|nr:hypothetical protein H696_05109 [Fonticula alba]KCV68180.1 hypothetical protein H696_05109 [Fonticula alba]|eukprot:XP_009497234.1 hypothetical protein H696_05109 [Fonticula alba]
MATLLPKSSAAGMHFPDPLRHLLDGLLATDHSVGQNLAPTLDILRSDGARMFAWAAAEETRLEAGAVAAGTSTDEAFQRTTLHAWTQKVSGLLQGRALRGRLAGCLLASATAHFLPATALARGAGAWFNHLLANARMSAAGFTAREGELPATQLGPTIRAAALHAVAHLTAVCARQPTLRRDVLLGGSAGNQVQQKVVALLGEVASSSRSSPAEVEVALAAFAALAPVLGTSLRPAQERILSGLCRSLSEAAGRQQATCDLAASRAFWALAGLAGPRMVPVSWSGAVCAVACAVDDALDLLTLPVQQDLSRMSLRMLAGRLPGPPGSGGATTRLLDFAPPARLLDSLATVTGSTGASAATTIELFGRFSRAADLLVAGLSRSAPPMLGPPPIPAGVLFLLAERILSLGLAPPRSPQMAPSSDYSSLLAVLPRVLAHGLRLLQALLSSLGVRAAAVAPRFAMLLRMVLSQSAHCPEVRIEAYKTMTLAVDILGRDFVGLDVTPFAAFCLADVDRLLSAAVTQSANSSTAPLSEDARISAASQGKKRRRARGDNDTSPPVASSVGVAVDPDQIPGVDLFDQAPAEIALHGLGFLKALLLAAGGQPEEIGWRARCELTLARLLVPASMCTYSAGELGNAAAPVLAAALECLAIAAGAPNARADSPALPLALQVASGVMASQNPALRAAARVQALPLLVANVHPRAPAMRGFSAEDLAGVAVARQATAAADLQDALEDQLALEAASYRAPVVSKGSPAEPAFGFGQTAATAAAATAAATSTPAPAPMVPATAPLTMALPQVASVPPSTTTPASAPSATEDSPSKRQKTAAPALAMPTAPVSASTPDNTASKKDESEDDLPQEDSDIEFDLDAGPDSDQD